MNLQNSCLGNCAPAQVINFNYAFNFEDVNDIVIYNNDGCEYTKDELEFAYSLDSNCWSCYMSYQELLNNTISLSTDFYLRVTVKGVIKSINVKGEAFTNYTTSLKTGFTLTGCDGSTTNSNLYNPYINMDCAISLVQQMTETVSCMFGIPIYYFKLAANAGSKDITFKEYTLMDVEAVKQIKMMVVDGNMPSSKPEVNDFGFDFNTDWETEISKATFATAFGNTAQPMEGDIIYVPMQKRMWMVNESYEEKKDGFMWNAQTFKVFLVKYQEKGSVDLGATEQLIDSFVKNKYDDLFGDQENLDSGFESVEAPTYAANDLYPVYESDATRKYVSVNYITFTTTSAKIIYQHKYCGTEGSISFIIKAEPGTYSGTLLEVANIKINIDQTYKGLSLFLINTNQKLSLSLNANYLIIIRWSKQLNIVEMSAHKYSWPPMPEYKLQSQHYYFNMDKALGKTVSPYNIEMIQETKGDIILHNFIGKITNIKILDMYNDNNSELLQMYPTNQHILVNDTARKLLDLNGVSIR